MTTARTSARCLRDRDEDLRRQTTSRSASQGEVLFQCSSAGNHDVVAGFPPISRRCEAEANPGAGDPIDGVQGHDSESWSVIQRGASASRTLSASTAGANGLWTKSTSASSMPCGDRESSV